MPKFQLKTLFLVVLIAGIALGLVPLERKIYRWRQGLFELEEFEKTNYLEYGYYDVNVAAKPVFEKAIEEIRNLGPFAKAEEKLAILDECILSLNEIQSDQSMLHSIESVEREQYCDVVLQLGDFISVDYQGRLDELRDWSP